MVHARHMHVRVSGDVGHNPGPSDDGRRVVNGVDTQGTASRADMRQLRLATSGDVLLASLSTGALRVMVRIFGDAPWMATIVTRAAAEIVARECEADDSADDGIGEDGGAS